MRKKVVVLSSGGLDSSVLIAHLCKEGRVPIPVFIDYEQVMANSEWSSLTSFCQKYDFPEPVHIAIRGIFSSGTSPLISQVDLWTEPVDPEQLVIPFRNAWLLSTGIAFAGTINASEVTAAFINSNHVKEIDASAKFLQDLVDHYEENSGISLQFPFREWTKTDVLRRGIELGIDILDTYSCQVNRNIACGACPNCVERQIAVDNINNRKSLGHEKP